MEEIPNLEGNLKSFQNQKAVNVVSLRNIKVRYTHDGPLVIDIDRLDIQKGERVAVIGQSGAGKTTLLRLINGYVNPESGLIKIFEYNKDTGPIRNRNLSRRIGFIFQHFNLIDRATVFENVLWGRLGMVNPFLSLFGWFPDMDKKAAMRAIKEVNLEKQAGQRTDTLSGGQLQRVAIARVLAQEAEIILADEPVSNLDPSLADDILGLLGEVSNRHGVTLIMNLHQPALAQRYADRIIGLKHGKIIHDDEASFLNPIALRSIFDPGINTSQLFSSNVQEEPSH
ncbi:MAG TPA: ATP-binding cassette domain-containing protein [Thermodesulfobacteriota bacterium]